MIPGRRKTRQYVRPLPVLRRSVTKPDGCYSASVERIVNSGAKKAENGGCQYPDGKNALTTATGATRKTDHRGDGESFSFIRP